MTEPEAPNYPQLLGDYVEALGEDPNVVQAAATAVALVERRIALFGNTTTMPVPREVKIEAVLTVGADLFYKRTARNGIVGLDDATVEPMRVSRDPLGAASGILAPYLILVNL